jgi:competence protein ComFC
MQKILSALGQMIFPNLCVCCSGYLGGQEEFICDLCNYTLPRFEEFGRKDNQVAQTFWGRTRLEFATSILQFSAKGDVQKVLHEIKYKGNTSLGVYMGEWMGRIIKEKQLFSEVDYIVPLPLHPKKELLRGYNQAELLVRGMCHELGQPMAKDVLIRTKHNSTQTKKHRYERFINTTEIFAVQDSDKLEGKHILLVDDVITTGATIEAAANVLLDVEGVRVSVVSLARA